MRLSDNGLDPNDWDSFRVTARKLLDACIDRLAYSEANPWIPVPNDVKERYKLDGSSIDHATLARRLKTEVMPYATGNTHPRFFGWVHGTGLAEGLLSEMVAATMNSNCGGRDHGMIYVEREVIAWAKSVFGFPAEASGVLVTGTSQATVVALSAARRRAVGAGIRTRGQQGYRLTAYAGSGVHNAIRKAIELLGIGSDNLRLVDDSEGGLDLRQMRRCIAEDRAAGALPFAVIGTSGSVDVGDFDDLCGLAALAQEENLWLHVDGAYGAWTRLADEPWRSLTDGIELADSIACDFHKWMYVQYDCGLVLIRNEDEQLATFAQRPAYLAGHEGALAGGDTWFCDYGIDLSRGNRALKVWSALQAHGELSIGEAISHNCRLAAYMGNLVETTKPLRLQAPVIANLCVFSANGDLAPEAQSEVNIAVARILQLQGEAVFSTTEMACVTYLRAAITNHRTREHDIEASIMSVVKVVHSNQKNL